MHIQISVFCKSSLFIENNDTSFFIFSICTLIAISSRPFWRCLVEMAYLGGFKYQKNRIEKRREEKRREVAHSIGHHKGILGVITAFAGGVRF
jgi:hypothetical protein